MKCFTCLFNTCFQCCAGALLLAVAFCGAAPGQELSGEIDGRVQDSSGAAVGNATVIVKNDDQNLVARTLKTNSQGQFTASLLPLAHYSVTASAQGFHTATLGVDVHTGLITTANF